MVVYTLLSTILLILIVARMHLLSFPLERDEGEYAYMASLMLEGHAPYTMAYNMKLPGTNFMYMVFLSLFGSSIEGIHLGLVFMSILSILCVYLIGSRFLSKIFAFTAAATFGILATSPYVLGQAAHATHVVVFFALPGIWFALKAGESKKNSLALWGLSGLCFSLALIAKQSGTFFILFGACAIVLVFLRKKKLSNLLSSTAAYLLGFMLPIASLLAYFYYFADFEKFWFWTVDYLRQYSNQLSFSEGVRNFKSSLRSVTGHYSSSGYVLLWIFAGLGFVLLFRKTASLHQRILLISLTVVSFITIVPGYYFRPHYFITLLPVIGLLTGYFFESSGQIIRNRWKMSTTGGAIVLFALILGVGIHANKGFLFNDNLNRSCKQLYGSNPFVESLTLAKYLRANTGDSDQIAILGSEPQVFFYAGRTSATGYIYTYNMMEIHEYALTMQEEMIAEIEKSKPVYLVYVDVPFSWLQRPQSQTYLIDWARQYVDSAYTIEALLEVSPKWTSPMVVLSKSPKYKPRTKEVVYVYRRKNS